jgi:hypothetical protein
LWTAVLATGGLLAGFSALESLGLRGYRKPQIQILMPERRRVFNPPEFVQVHRTAQLCRVDIHLSGTPPATWHARSVVDAAQWARNDEEACMVISASFQQRLVAHDAVHQAVARMHGVIRERLILRAADDARCGAESFAEIDFARLCRRHGLPEPTRRPSAPTPEGANATATCCSRSTACTSKSTVGSTWRYALGPATCASTTRSSSRDR